MWELVRLAGRRGSAPGKPESSSPAVQSEFSRHLVQLDESHLQPNFSIDVVYTWSDYADPRFQDELWRYRPETARDAIAGDVRWTCHEELRYSLRSLALYAPWVNKIYIVTNGQRPEWLADTSKVEVVRHSDILDPEYLPTFNSHVIESALHRLPGLSEHYIYFNDDVMLLRPLGPSQFFTANGLALAFLSDVTVPPGSPCERETATNWGVKNARTLLGRSWQTPPSRRFAHTCHPQRKSVAEDSERTFADAYHRFRKNRFRASDDLLVTSYLNPCFGYFTAKALFVSAPYWYVKIREPQARDLYRLILSDKGKPTARLSVCTNDHPKGENQLNDPEAALVAFLKTYFSKRGPYEKDRLNISMRTNCGRPVSPLEI